MLLAVGTGKAERAKGSKPTSKKPGETIAMRRVRELHAAVVAQKQTDGGGARLSLSQRRH